MTIAQELSNFPSDVIEQIADAVAEKLLKKVPIELELWAVPDIAVYLRRSVATVRDNVVQLPGFPKPIQLDKSGQRGSQRLYKAAEVISWAMKQQAK